MIKTLLVVAYLFTLLLLLVFALRLYRRVAKANRPMLLFFIALVVFETMQMFFLRDESDQIATKLRYLVEVSLILWQASMWKVYGGKRWVLWTYVSFMIVFLIVESWFHLGWFRLVYSLGIVGIGIEMANRSLTDNPLPSFRNPGFLFSFGLIFYYLVATLLEVSQIVWQTNIDAAVGAILYIYLLQAIITTLIFIRASLCISAKPKYSIS